jgi:acetyl-CoA C-acetyltransferase
MIFCSVQKARELSIPEEKWVYPLVSSESNFMMDVSERPSVGQCPGAEIAGKAALEYARVTPQDLQFIDLYTCFPIAVETYAEALGISLDRELTVTGGMPFAGGPLNNYVFQATCRMAEQLRQNPGATGLVTSVSGLLTKQGFGVWSRKAPSQPFGWLDLTKEVANSVQLKHVIGDYSGTATIVAYTTLYEGADATRAVAIVDIDDSTRTVVWSSDPAILESFQGSEEFCGRTVAVEEDTFAFAK